MGILRPCPWCGRKHRSKKAARKCLVAHKGAPKWTEKELV